MAGPRVTVVTAANPGAIGIIQISGEGAADLLTAVTGLGDWRPNRLRLADFGDIDRGVAVLLSNEMAQLMPHGGVRVIQLIVDRLLALGGTYDAAPSPRELYPEAETELEAQMLHAVAQAASPAAIDLLLAQPGLWNESINEDLAAIRTRSDRWDRLITPPSVVVAGPPNVGKSTLTNHMLGRSASVVADLPGTTRDWVAGLAEIGDVAVRWMDTPGIRHSDDPIEQNAIELAHHVIETADVLIAMRDPDTAYPDLTRRPDLHVVNKCDLLAGAPDDGLAISALNGDGIDQLERRIIKCLQLDDIDQPALWAFCPELRAKL